MIISFTRHAIQRMAERNIDADDVERAVSVGATIREYPDDKPNPSTLAYLDTKNGPLHVVYSVVGDRDFAERLVITVYRPDPVEWDSTFTRKRGKK